MNFFERLRRWRAWKRYYRSFGEYHRSAYLSNPELIGNPSGIHLCWGVRIRPHARLECLKHKGRLGRLEIGGGTCVEYYFHAAAAELVRIGQRVLIAGRVYITDHDHEMPWDSGGLIARPVIIGDGCWLGEGCCILKGVELGPGCVVGANAVVTKSFPSGSVIGGVQAVPLKRLVTTVADYGPSDRRERNDS